MAGFALDKGTDNTLHGARLLITPGDIEVLTYPDGQFNVILQPGTYQLVISEDEFIELTTQDVLSAR